MPERFAAAPEKAFARIVARLRHHALWNAALMVVPPLAACVYLFLRFYRAGWHSLPVFFGLTSMAIAAVVCATRICYRAPSVAAAARRVDELSGAQDRFLTLATLVPDGNGAQLFSRLRVETVSFLGRIDLRRDFPFEVKRSFYWSLTGSLMAAFLFHLLVLTHSILQGVPVPQELRELAEQMAPRAGLTSLARGLETLAAKLEDRTAPPQERQFLVQQLRKELQEQQKKEQPKDNQQLLGRAAGALTGLEQQAGSGREEQKNHGQGEGIQSNLSQEGQSQGKSSAGSGGESKGEHGAQRNNEMQPGKSTEGDAKGQGQEKNQRREGESKGNQADQDQAGADKNQQTAGKTPSGSEEKGGRDKVSENIPRGAPPPDRLYQAGQQPGSGVKGAGYVNVQLPEDSAAETKGERSGAKDGKNNRVGAKPPVSNMPLPAHIPDAPAEKQQMPLEYRGIIR